MGFYIDGLLFFLIDPTNLENIHPACQVSWFPQGDLQKVAQTSNSNNLISSLRALLGVLVSKSERKVTLKTSS